MHFSVGYYVSPQTMLGALFLRVECSLYLVEEVLVDVKDVELELLLHAKKFIYYYYFLFAGLESNKKNSPTPPPLPAPPIFKKALRSKAIFLSFSILILL